MKKISIREKLILYFVVISVISIAIVSFFSIFEARKGITNRTFSQLILLRDLRREQILTFFNTRHAELRTVALSDDIVQMADLIRKKELEGVFESILLKDRNVLNSIDDPNYCRSIYYVSVDGNAYQYQITGMGPGFGLAEEYSLFDNGMFSSLNTDKGIEENSVFELIEAPGASHIFIAAVVYSEDGLYTGALISEIRPEAIYRIIYDEIPGLGLGKTGEAYLVGVDGLMKSPSRFIPGAVQKIKVETFGFREAIEGKEGVRIYPDYRGIKILGAYGSLKIGDLAMVILAEIDVDEALVPLRDIRNEILLVSLIILLVIFIITWFLAHGITRPLIRLKNAAQLISAGNYNQQLEIKVDDEIGELTQAFNSMALEIKSTTQDLRENEERLRHFYRATLDGIILHENDRMILYNSAMIDLTGYAENELPVFRVSDFLQIKKGPECSQDTEPKMFESVLIRKDGTGLPVEIQESCVDYEGKNIRASVIRDISARKKMEAELATERNKRIRAVFDGQDLERQRLSRELHDGLGQQLVAGKLILESSLYAANPDDLKPGIGEAQRIFDRIISDIRRISHDLSPSILQEFGLRAAMENLCNGMAKTSGIRVDFSFNLDVENPDEMTATYLYRIAQEALNNAQRHSGATGVKVSLNKDQFGFLLEIEDNGCGFQVKEIAKKGGNGLYNIRERVNILKGNLSLKSKPGRGTQILVRVPAGDNQG